MPEWLAVVLLGLIEGITEFLPVSSTGHLLLAEHYLPRQTDLFNTVVQSGAVLAVLVVFYQRVKSFVVHWRQQAVQSYLFKLAAAFGITAAGGLALKKLHFKLPETTQPVAIATLVGGILFVVLETYLRRRPSTDMITWRVALAMGAAQLLAAIFPGTSRSGATILLALAMGVSRSMATEFSFLLGIPTLLAAGCVQSLGALRDPTPHANMQMLALGSAVAALTAFGVVRWLLQYVREHNFIAFGYYRMALGLGMLLLTH